MSKSRNEKALRLVEHHALYATGAGLIPLPLIDLAALAAMQVRLVNELGRLYQVPDLNTARSKAIIHGLFKNMGVTALAAGGIGSLAKMVPLLGSLVGVATMPVLAGAFTYATGITFMRHFNDCGTLANFDLKTQVHLFKQALTQGKQEIRKFQKRKPPLIVSAEEDDPLANLPIYTIFKPKLGKSGKVYLKSYVDGKRPEKYLGTMEAFKTKYAVQDLATVSDQIIEDHRDLFLAHLKEKAVKA